MIVSRVITLEEVKKHSTRESCWIIIDGFVYEVTSWLCRHPGGGRIIGHYGGQDASVMLVMQTDHKICLCEIIKECLFFQRMLGEPCTQTESTLTNFWRVSRLADYWMIGRETATTKLELLNVFLTLVIVINKLLSCVAASFINTGLRGCSRG